MPAGAIVGAVVAITIAAEVATPIAIGLAVIATAGAVASTVGTITGDKTLSLVGNIMGAVGSIGTIASGLGAFGEAAAILGGGEGITNAAGGAVAEIAPTAVDTATATGGLNAYTPEFLQAFDSAYASSGSVEGALSSANAAVAGASPPGDIVNMLSGEVSRLTVASAEPPTPVPSEVVAPAATDTVASAEAITPNPEAELAVDPSRGLVNQPLSEPPPGVQSYEFADPTASATPMVSNEVTPVDYMNASVADPNAMPVDPYGNPIAQGGGDGGTLGAYNNPAAPQDPSTAYADGTFDNGSQMWQGGDKPGTESPATAGGKVTGAAGGQPNDALIFAKNNPGSIRHTGSSPDSIWSDIWGFAKENKSLVLGGMMSLGSFMSGALSPKTPAEVDALSAQAERNRAAAQLEYTQNQLMQRRLNNMSQPLPVAYRGSGLINMAPVTGRPA